MMADDDVRDLLGDLLSDLFYTDILRIVLSADHFLASNSQLLDSASQFYGQLVLFSAKH